METTAGAFINKDDFIRDILNKYPGSIEVFRVHNMDCPECMGGPEETIETGSRLCCADLASLLADLNRMVVQGG